jgi:hypothetical protein
VTFLLWSSSPAEFPRLAGSIQPLTAGRQAPPFTEEAGRMANETLAHGVNISIRCCRRTAYSLPRQNSVPRRTSRACEEYERIYAEAAEPIRKPSGGRSQRSCTGSLRGPRFSNLTHRGPSGSSEGRSISLITVLTVMPILHGATRIAILWEGEPGDTRTLTYAQLLAEVELFANALKGLGVGQGRPSCTLHGHGS